MALMSRFEMFLWSFIVALAILLAVLVDRADAHTSHELDEWMTGWSQQADNGLSQPLLLELQDMRQRHPCWTTCEEVMPNDSDGSERTQPRPDVAAPPLAPAQIRALVEAHFPADEVDDALAVAFCESRYNPTARNGSHKGLFQIAGFWSQSFGMDPYDPASNVYMAYQIWLRGHPRAGPGPNYGHWVCQPDGSYWYF